MANKIRHSNSQALFPSQPLMKATRLDAIRAHNAANHIEVSDPGGEMNSSIHFTIEENSGEIGFLSSMNASRGFKPAIAPQGRIGGPVATSALGNQGSAEQQSMGDRKLSVSRGRSRPNFASS